MNNYTFNSTNIFRNLNKTTYTNVYIFINIYKYIHIYTTLSGFNFIYTIKTLRVLFFVLDRSSFIYYLLLLLLFLCMHVRWCMLKCDVSKNEQYKNNSKMNIRIIDDSKKSRYFLVSNFLSNF